MATFSVDSLNDVVAEFVAAPARLYGDTRAATVIGPAGELIELIEEPRA